MARRTKKEKAKIAKRLAIASVLLIISSYIVKEVLKENLKELHDSLASAESQFRAELDQSAISLQLINVQQQIESIKLEAGSKDPHRDFSALIAQDILQAQQAKAHLDADFDGVSRLIEKFPSAATDLRKLRDQVREQIEKVDKQIDEMLKPKPEHDLGRFVEVKMAMVFALVDEIPVAVLGDATLTAAHQVQEATERLIRICTWTIYVLFFLGAALALYAAVTGIKSEAAE
jgi:hypothetical protein